MAPAEPPAAVIVLDSSFLIAYHNQRDVHHPAAARAMERVLQGEWGRALLLEYVFLEVVTVLLARSGLQTAIAVATALLQAAEVDFVACSDVFLDTWETFLRQRSGTLSFTDAAIVTVARQRQARVATFDVDFRDLEDISVVPD
jgi:predicted nucleic acid-binding protein